jgi:hypothetical protein
LGVTDQKLEAFLSVNRVHSSLESLQAVLLQQEFLDTWLEHYRVKLSLILLMDGKKVGDIQDPFTEIPDGAYLVGLAEWNDHLMAEVKRRMNRKEEITGQPVPETRTLRRQVEFAKRHLNLMLLSMQLDEIKSIAEKMSRNFLNPPIPILRQPASSKGRELMEKPIETDQIFVNEVNTCRFLITEKLMTEISNIWDGRVIETAKLERLCLQMSDLLETFMTKSINRLPVAWYLVVKPFVQAQSRMEESRDLLQFFSSRMRLRYRVLLQTDCALILQDRLLVINQVTDAIDRRRRQVIRDDAQCHEDIRNDFDRLLIDLEKRRLDWNSEFHAVHRFVYDLVLKRIEAAKSVRFERTTMIATNWSSNKVQFAVLRDEIQKLALLARRFRIVRALAGIASLRYSKKRIDSGEEDRIQELGQLWESKRDFELVQMQMVQQVDQAYRRLTDCELEIDRLTQQLENEKQSTIQLVHWKSTTLKREDQLMTDLKLVEHAGSVHIGNLLRNLESKTEVLEELREGAEEMEIEIEKSVRTPIRKSDCVRSSIQELRIKKAAGFKRLAPTDDSEIPSIGQLREENVELRARNAALRLEVEQMEEALRQFPKETVTFSEDLIPAARQVLSKTSGTVKRGQITRPKTSYSVSRPGFEFLPSRDRR